MIDSRRHRFEPGAGRARLWSAVALGGLVGVGSGACRNTPPTTAGGSGSTTVGGSTAPSATATASSDADSWGGGMGGTTTPVGSSSDGASTTDRGTTGDPACTRNVVLMGYWPPTNEMLRPWSTNATQNPGGWVGENWGGHGYDVYSFFPEFPPDGDPTNDSIGDDGAVGSPRFDLRVDYQATSEDFWRIIDTHQPVILITTSRGGQIGWELEAIEGGHGQGNPGGPAQDWSSDQHGAVQLPTETSIEPRSWDAISMYRQGDTLPSQLPLDAIVNATEPLGVTSVEIDPNTSGNFLSGFLGLHGLYYQSIAPHAVAAGHIHVGFGLPVADAAVLIEQTLQTVLEQHPARSVPCSPR
ncbi:MAG: hypothetical protein AAF799_12240 [Myxococcota bacterium]